MNKQEFDLNEKARQKINEQYEYADERVSGSEGRIRPKKAAAPAKRPAEVNETAPPVSHDKPAVNRTDGIKRAEKRPAVSEPPHREPPHREPEPEAHIPPPKEKEPKPKPKPKPQPVKKVRKPNLKREQARRKFWRIYRRFAVVIILLGTIYISLNVGFLYYRGQLWFNEPRKRDYPVRGAIVTSSLGEMDWAEFQYQMITFAYVRATRGTKFIDEQYSVNRPGVDDSRLWAGFYHEFDFSEDGTEQAEHYINTVGDLYGELRPAVKLTLYGAYKLRMRSAEKVREQLNKYLDRIKQEYGRRAVIMCDSDCYEKYIKPYFSDQTLWLIDHFNEPDENTDWALWEYNPRVRSLGYSNSKEYYSVVVYRHGKDITNFRKNFEIGYE